MSSVMVGCAADVDTEGSAGLDEPEVGGTSQALTALTTSSFTMSGAYYGTGPFSGNSCSSLYKKSIVGSEPANSGKYPVFVYVTGTAMSFTGPEAITLTTEMAKRGFVAGTVEYDNALYPTCSGGMTAKASCIFNGGSSNSAVSALCSRAKADCSKGIVVAGFSQGANLGALSKNYDSRVRAAYLMGHGNNAAGLINVSSCANNAATALLPSQMRSVNGENDGFFGGNPTGVRNQLTAVVGVSCPNSWNCIQPDGSGWAIVKASDLADHGADHCYFYNNGSLTCAPSSFDPTWSTGTVAWSMGTDLDWLASKASQ